MAANASEYFEIASDWTGRAITISAVAVHQLGAMSSMLCRSGGRVGLIFASEPGPDEPNGGLYVDRVVVFDREHQPNMAVPGEVAIP
ncbi:hypothetical protein EV182_001835, partial [Spiromyces aspiralis]